MNLQKELKNLKGQTYKMSFMSGDDIKEIAEKKGMKEGEVKTVEVPRETVKNVLLNCLANYSLGDKKEMFSVQIVAAWMNDESEEKKPLSDKMLAFLRDKVLPQAIIQETVDKRTGQTTSKGLYHAWVISQVMEELGAKIEE